MWSWVITLLAIALSAGFYFYSSSSKKAPGKKLKNKVVKEAKEVVEKVNKSKANGKKGKTDNKVKPTPKAENKAKEEKPKAPVETSTEEKAPSTNNKKNKAKKSSTPETPAKEIVEPVKETPKPIENAEVEAKDKKKKKKKPAKKEAEVPEPETKPDSEFKSETVEEPQIVDDSSFTMPANVVKPDRRTVNGLSERKPVESVNRWALLDEVNE